MRTRNELPEWTHAYGLYECQSVLRKFAKSRRLSARIACQAEDILSRIRPSNGCQVRCPVKGFLGNPRDSAFVQIQFLDITGESFCGSVVVRSDYYGVACVCPVRGHTVRKGFPNTKSLYKFLPHFRHWLQNPIVKAPI